MSDFITDVERQYEMYCKIAEEHGYIDLNAKKNGFRCTTKSIEFNAGWIAFVGAVAAVRDEQQAIIDDLKAQLNNMEACYIEKKKQVEAVDAVLMNWRDEYTEFAHQHECTVDAVLRTCIAELEQALRGASD